MQSPARRTGWTGCPTSCCRSGSPRSCRPRSAQAARTFSRSTEARPDRHAPCDRVAARDRAVAAVAYALLRGVGLLAHGGAGQHCRHADHRPAHRRPERQPVCEHRRVCRRARGDLLRMASRRTHVVDRHERHATMRAVRSGRDPMHVRALHRRRRSCDRDDRARLHVRHAVLRQVDRDRVRDVTVRRQCGAGVPDRLHADAPVRRLGRQSARAGTHPSRTRFRSSMRDPAVPDRDRAARREPAERRHRARPCKRRAIARAGTFRCGFRVRGAWHGAARQSGRYDGATRAARPSPCLNVSRRSSRDRSCATG